MLTYDQIMHLINSNAFLLRTIYKLAFKKTFHLSDVCVCVWN